MALAVLGSGICHIRDGAPPRDGHPEAERTGAGGEQRAEGAPHRTVRPLVRPLLALKRHRTVRPLVRPLLAHLGSSRLPRRGVRTCAR
eukprot:1032856-Prymnesium_polylepis.2